MLLSAPSLSWRNLCIATSKPSDLHLFSPSMDTNPWRAWFSSKLHDLFLSSGLPPEHYSPHSLRIGAATTAALHLAPSTLKSLGCWSSATSDSTKRTFCMLKILWRTGSLCSGWLLCGSFYDLCSSYNVLNKYWNVLSVSEQVGVGHVIVLVQWGCVGWQAVIGWLVGGSGVNEEEAKEDECWCEECRNDKQEMRHFLLALIKLQIRREVLCRLWSEDAKICYILFVAFLVVSGFRAFDQLGYSLQHTCGRYTFTR